MGDEASTFTPGRITHDDDDDDDLPRSSESLLGETVHRLTHNQSTQSVVDPGRTRTGFRARAMDLMTNFVENQSIHPSIHFVIENRKIFRSFHGNLRVCRWLRVAISETQAQSSCRLATSDTR